MNGLRRVLISTFGLVGAFAFGVPSVASAPELGSLVVSDPPDGYVISTDPSAWAGQYTMQQIFDLLGEPVPGSPSAADLAGFSAYVRTWDRVNVDRLLIILFETPTAAEADFIVTNSLAEFRAQNYEAFDPGVPGTFGAVLTDAGFTVHVVMWQQGSYAVEIVGGSRDIARGKSAVGELASDQRDLLLSKLGVDASAVPDSKDNSVAYLAGKIAGTLAVFGVITAIVVLIVQRSRRKQNEAPLLPQPYGTFTPSGAPFVSPTQPPMPPPPPPPYDPPRHN